MPSKQTLLVRRYLRRFSCLHGVGVDAQGGDVTSKTASTGGEKEPRTHSASKQACRRRSTPWGLVPAASAC